VRPRRRGQRQGRRGRDPARRRARHAAARFDQATLAEVEIETWRRVQAVDVEAAPGLTRTPAAAITGQTLNVDSGLIFH